MAQRQVLADQAAGGQRQHVDRTELVAERRGVEVGEVGGVGPGRVGTVGERGGEATGTLQDGDRAPGREPVHRPGVARARAGPAGPLSNAIPGSTTSGCGPVPNRT